MAKIKHVVGNIKGEPGDTGAPGAKGLVGNQGPKGPRGDPASFDIQFNDEYIQAKKISGGGWENIALIAYIKALAPKGHPGKDGQVITNHVSGVTLNKNTLALNVGSSETLVATVNPVNATNKSVTWETSDISKATVVNGLVTAIAAGGVTITVRTVDGDFTDTCALTVSVATIPVSSISLNKTTSSLETPNTETLIATISPDTATNKSVTWETSNASLATVSPTGLVTSKAAGSVTITVKSVADPTKTASCVYTITEPITPPSGNKIYYTSSIEEWTSGSQWEDGTPSSVWEPGSWHYKLSETDIEPSIEITLSTYSLPDGDIPHWFEVPSASIITKITESGQDTLAGNGWDISTSGTYKGSGYTRYAKKMVRPDDTPEDTTYTILFTI
jgi:transglutaminase/protease-like cytokinesis protein 3